MEEASNTQSKNESLCKVCGDKASGKHYGVPSCDGCRGFFKRSIRRNLEYVCKENGRCVVDVTRRNQCQACRFKKCLQVNMKRDAVQHERAPRSIQTGFHHHHHYGLNFTSKLRGIPGKSALEPNSRLELPTIGESTTKSIVRSTDASCMSSYSIENIYESAAKLLFLALKWAKTIPSFLQLSCRDQSILLEESWNELFILTAAQWDLPIDENFLVNNVSRQTARNEFLEEDARKLSDIINRLNLLHVDHTEHACLKALVLFKSGK
ncbi:nuclear receptor subfamily 2 group E member 1-like [Agrilus planipennis]|uniref:Nuclear receptor subfamily 2 group E member 1-like n=1 Tax=Agrilus planipennis TaxID=224129 RepID=A0A7F5R3N2_AGRPL|nr:nuclear receptor subfamily 2 group E member 1-like [Agrilus planipennis]